MCIRDRGYAATSMDAVTALAGVSKQTIYSYFPSKGELFADFLDGELGHLRVDVGAPAPITSTAQLLSLIHISMCIRDSPRPRRSSRQRQRPRLNLTTWRWRLRTRPPPNLP